MRLPAYPAADADGHYPADETFRVSIARRMIELRRGARLTKKKLATLSGVSVDEISRVESGEHPPKVGVIEKLRRALTKAGA